MKMTITTKDVANLTGKFIVQHNADNPDRVINDENWGFFQEKRISFVCGLNLCGFYYMHKELKTEQEFVDYFNDPCRNGTRFYRLLTSKEIDFVTNKMKEANY
jgi:hypothetical protein